jgi:hypothetical protein
VRRVAFLLACATWGCPSAAVPKQITLYPLTGAPPARTIEVVNKPERHALTVSAGVAFAVNAYDQCDPPTEAPMLQIADESVLKEHPLTRGTAKRQWVLVGVRPGKTTLTVKADCATQTYEVTVLAQ